MDSFKLFLVENNTHAESTLDDAFEKAWKRHGPDIEQIIKEGDLHHPLNRDLDRAAWKLVGDKKDKKSWLATHVKNTVRNNDDVETDTMLPRPLYRDKDLKMSSKAMPGSHPKYIDWVLKQLKGGSVGIEDLYTRIRPNLEKYDHLKRHGLLRDDITNKISFMQDTRTSYSEYDNSLHPPIQRRDGTKQYDSHASADFNNLSGSNLHSLVNHREYEQYFDRETHKEAMARLKPGIDYDIIHDSTPGGRDRDKLSIKDQQLKRGVRVYHAKTEEAAQALAIHPETNEPTEWCTGTSGLHGGNQAFRDYNEQGPILVYHGENSRLSGSYRMHQVHIPSNQWMDEADQHAPELDADHPHLHMYPSFTGDHAREATLDIASKDPEKYRLFHSTNHYSLPTPLGVAIRQRFGDYMRYKNSLMLHTIPPYRDKEEVLKNVGAFKGISKEREDNLSALLSHEPRQLILDPTISHKTKYLLATHGTDGDRLGLTSPKIHLRDSSFRHELDVPTMRAILASNIHPVRPIDAAPGRTVLQPSDYQYSVARVIKRVLSEPDHPLKDHVMQPEFANYHNHILKEPKWAHLI